MIEYTIKVQRVLLSQGEVLVYLTPINAEGLEPLRHVVHIQKERFAELSGMDANTILEEIRTDIVKCSPSFQHRWEIQQAAIDAALPSSVLLVEGREFPLVTADEQDLYIPKPVEVAKTEEVVI